MCGSSKLIERAFPPDQVIAGVIVQMREGFLFYPAYKGGIEEARTISRRICEKDPLKKIVYSGRPAQVQATIRNLNQLNRLKGYDPVQDFKRVRGAIT